MKTNAIMRLFVAGCLLSGALAIHAKDNAPVLVVRIDDLGAFHSVNEACIGTYRSGIAKSVEVMPVAAWFPEAVKMLKENPGLDAGVHLAITSEWENAKWRPLTHCPSLTDENGYFYPMMFPNAAYPGQSILEQKPDMKEIEQEFRAQIEMALKNIPQLSHISGHMLSTGFNKEVNELVRRLAQEYNLTAIDRSGSAQEYEFSYMDYNGPKVTPAEKEAAFISALGKLEPGKRYLFLDHPAYDNDEMKTVFHIGYEDVAKDRQGVTDFMTSPRVQKAIDDNGIRLITINQLTKGLPRAEASKKGLEYVDKAMAEVSDNPMLLQRKARLIMAGNNSKPNAEVVAEYQKLLDLLNKDPKNADPANPQNELNMYKEICLFSIQYYNDIEPDKDKAAEFSALYREVNDKINGTTTPAE